MADEPKSGTGDKGAQVSGQLEMETIILNNREVTVPKEAAQILKEMEHNLSSGLKTKYEEQLSEMRVKEESIKQQQASMQEALKADINWLNSHPQEAWEHYNLRIDGGDGKYIGDPSLLESGEPPDAGATKKPLNNNPILDEINRMKAQLNEMSSTQIERDTQSSIDAMRQFVKQSEYQYADVMAVTAQMKNYHLLHGKPASTETIKDYLAKSHKHAADIVGKVQKQSTTKTETELNIPEPSGMIAAREIGAPPKLTETNINKIADYAARFVQRHAGLK